MERRWRCIPGKLTYLWPNLSVKACRGATANLKPRSMHCSNKSSADGELERRESSADYAEDMSCEAATRAKPRARLCEPWVTVRKNFRSRGAANRVILPMIFVDSAS